MHVLSGEAGVISGASDSCSHARQDTLGLWQSSCPVLIILAPRQWDMVSDTLYVSSTNLGIHKRWEKIFREICFSPTNILTHKNLANIVKKRVGWRSSGVRVQRNHKLISLQHFHKIAFFKYLRLWGKRWIHFYFTSLLGQLWNQWIDVS